MTEQSQQSQQSQQRDDGGRDGLTVVDVPDRSRYELRRGADVLGRVDYHADAGRVVLDHTVVDQHRQERGLGGVLAEGVLDDLRKRGLRAVPRCTFIAAYLRRHPEYADVVEPPGGEPEPPPV